MANLSYKVIGRQVERIFDEMKLTESDALEFAEHFICRVAVAQGATTDLGQWLIDHALRLTHLRSLLNLGTPSIKLEYLKREYK